MRSGLHTIVGRGTGAGLLAFACVAVLSGCAGQQPASVPVAGIADGVGPAAVSPTTVADPAVTPVSGSATPSRPGRTTRAAAAASPRTTTAAGAGATRGSMVGSAGSPASPVRSTTATRTRSSRSAPGTPAPRTADPAGPGTTSAAPSIHVVAPTFALVGTDLQVTSHAAVSVADYEKFRGLSCTQVVSSSVPDTNAPWTFHVSIDGNTGFRWPPVKGATYTAEETCTGDAGTFKASSAPFTVPA